MSGFVPMFPSATGGADRSASQAWPPPRKTTGHGFVRLEEYVRLVQIAQAEAARAAAAAGAPAGPSSEVAPAEASSDLAPTGAPAEVGPGALAEEAAEQSGFAAQEEPVSPPAEVSAPPPSAVPWPPVLDLPDPPAAPVPAPSGADGVSDPVGPFGEAPDAPGAAPEPSGSEPSTPEPAPAALAGPAPEAPASPGADAALASIDALKRRALEEARAQAIEEARELAKTELAGKLRSMEREIERLRVEAARSPASAPPPEPAAAPPADDGRVALLERQISRLAGALEAAERQRDEAQRLAAALEVQGPAGFANIRDRGLKADDPNRDKKLSLMKTIQAENRALREALGRALSPVEASFAAPVPADPAPVAVPARIPAPEPVGAPPEPLPVDDVPSGGFSLTNPDDLDWEITPLEDDGGDGAIARIDVAALIGREPPPRERG